MPQITIDLDSDENKNIEIFKAQEELKNKEQAIKLVIRKFFKMNLQSIKKRGK